MDIAILIFDGLTALDAVGPYEVLSRLPGATVTFVAESPGEKRTDVGSLGLVADRALGDLAHPEILVVPGGPGEAQASRSEAVLGWVRGAHQTSRWTTSVCTGSLILGRAGLLQGVRATSHWTAMEALAATGAVPVSERVVTAGKIITAAGVSAGIDMALRLVGELAGIGAAEAIQLSIEYDPQPPLDRGSVAKARPELVEALWARSRFAPATAAEAAPG